MLIASSLNFHVFYVCVLLVYVDVECAEQNYLRANNRSSSATIRRTFIWQTFTIIEERRRKKSAFVQFFLFVLCIAFCRWNVCAKTGWDVRTLQRFKDVLSVTLPHVDRVASHYMVPLRLLLCVCLHFVHLSATWVASPIMLIVFCRRRHHRHRRRQLCRHCCHRHHGGWCFFFFVIFAAFRTQSPTTKEFSAACAKYRMTRRLFTRQD